MSRFILVGALALMPLAAQAQTRVSIPQIQGAADASPLAGQSVSTSGTVTAIFPQLRGFYVQDPKGDGNPQTSDGLFVYLGNKANGLATMKVGDGIQLVGTVEEFKDQTQLSNLTTFKDSGPTTPVAPTDVTFPLPVTDREKFEGMLVRVVTPMTVTDNYPLGRYGTFSLSSGGRVFVSSNVADPQPDADARTLVVDDASNKQNPDPVPFVDAQNTLRAGNQTASATGIMAYGFDTYRLYPTATIAFDDKNPRPLTAPVAGGNFKIASANLHNYWTTLKDDAHPNARGSSTPAEFEEQSGKIVSELKGLDADVVACMELENNGDGAIDDVIARLNKAYGATVYAKVPDPANGFGTDAIRVGMIYKPARVQLVGPALSYPAAIYERLPVAQTFKFNNTTFTLVANHWKSKGSPAKDGSDPDTGQGAWNKKRVQQAQTTLKFIQTLNQPNVLLVGDLNAYTEEDPLKTLRAGGMKHLNLRLAPDERYSFGFSGKFGSLDHALASDSLDKMVTGFAEWHVNSDEPEFELEKSPGTPFRASDHDPFLVGLQLP